MLNTNNNGEKELVIGKISNQEIAEWFGISYKTFRNTKKKRLEELEFFCDFEEVYGGLLINKIHQSVYQKQANKNYRIIKDNFDKEWNESRLDSGSNVALKIYNKHKNELSITERTAYDYTLKVRNELYGRPYVSMGEKGYCIYLWCKKEILEDGTCVLTQFTEEEEQIKKKLMKQYFSTDIEKEVMIAEMVDNGEITEAEAYRITRAIKGLSNQGFLNFKKSLEEIIGSKVIRGTLIQKNNIDYVNFGELNQTIPLIK